MTLDPAFVADCPYLPAGLLIDEIVSVDRESSTLVARAPTHDELPLTRDQRVDPLLHPRHINGGLMIHLTGMVGFAHAYYVLDLRHRDGWIGYGTHVHSGRFRKLCRIGSALVLSCRATSVRRIRGAIYARYELRFRQDDELVYEGDHSAIWTRPATTSL
jgi:hypothetical protein